MGLTRPRRLEVSRFVAVGAWPCHESGRSTDLLRGRAVPAPSHIVTQTPCKHGSGYLRGVTREVPVRLLRPSLLLVLAACDTGAEDAPSPEATLGETLAGHCVYTNPFSQAEECREYRGADWTAELATDDCAAPGLGAEAGAFTADAACAYDSILGTCVIDEGTASETALVFPGDDPGACSGTELGCGFAQGTFYPSALCEGGGGQPNPSGGGLFQPFQEECVDDGEGGETCAWGAISACAEEGLRFDDVASCDPVITQRPYVPYPVADTTAPDDSRLSDTAYMAELGWVTEQVEACACICCHSTQSAPDGETSGWYLEADGVWVDGLSDDGLAMLAGWVDSTAFGAFPPEDNNGFDRETTGLPTTDIARMQAYLEGELARRGRTRDSFDDTAPFGGPLYDQLFHEPEACTGDVGIGADGTITWSGGGARYLYVLEADSMSPGVPPNLDRPEGTLWRVDVDPMDEPIASPAVYGTVPSGAFQDTPAMGAPDALVPGETYYLYVLRDVYQPLVRCLTTIPE